MIPYGRQSISDADIEAVTTVLNADFLTTGPKVEEFENAIADYCGANYCVATSNGTAALHLASLALLNKNDKVLTTPNSFLATSNAILYVGAKPIFVDITADGNIDLDLCEQALKCDTSIKAIYAVAFSGNMLNQDKLRHLKDTYNILILEDNAHAIGAVYDGIKSGSCSNSDVSIFSFHPVKHITTGEGGAITTNSSKIYQKLCLLRNHGMVKNDAMNPWEYEMVALGFNYRITDIQCALGLSQLKKLDDFIAKRIEIAKIYDKAFAATNIQPIYQFRGKSSYHLYVVMVDFEALNITREQLFLQMKNKGIGLQVHYMPINKQPFYQSLGYGKEKTPVMDNYYQACFSLPMYPDLKSEEQDFVIQNLLNFLVLLNA